MLNKYSDSDSDSDSVFKHFLQLQYTIYLYITILDNILSINNYQKYNVCVYMFTSVNYYILSTDYLLLITSDNDNCSTQGMLHNRISCVRSILL